MSEGDTAPTAQLCRTHRRTDTRTPFLALVLEMTPFDTLTLAKSLTLHLLFFPLAPLGELARGLTVLCIVNLLSTCTIVRAGNENKGSRLLHNFKRGEMIGDKIMSWVRDRKFRNDSGS